MKDTYTHIWKFIAANQLFTLATCHRGKPYCTPCFYAFDPIDRLLIFKSSSGTRHITELLLQPQVAGSILPKSMSIGNVKGVQLGGVAMALKERDSGERLKQLYYKRFPMAITLKGSLWVVELESIKMTDNTLGFGTKLFWERVGEVVG